MDRAQDCSIFTVLAPGKLLLILFFINMVFQSENTCSIFTGTWVIHSPTSTYYFCNFTVWLHKRTQTIAVIHKMQWRAAGIICRNMFCGWLCFIYRNVSGFLGDGTLGQKNWWSYPSSVMRIFSSFLQT